MDLGVPQRITLEPVDDDPFRDRRRSARAARALTNLGYLPAGAWRVAEMPGVALRGFIHELTGAIATISEHPRVGLWTDLFLLYRDGGSVTVTNVPFGGELDQLPGHEKLQCDARGPAMLHALLLEARDGRPVRRIAPADFARVFEDRYEELTRRRMDAAA